MRVVVTPDPIDAAATLGAFQAAHADAGAIASFIGQVRGGETRALELEIYSGFTERQVEAGLAPVAVSVAGFWALHRYGRLLPGETIVVVLAAAVHRRAAFQAVDRAMDFLKTEAAFWKRERTDGGDRWIEPRPEDYADAQRWR